MINVLIIDDEHLARQRILKLLLPYSDYINVKGECRNGTEAVRKIKEVQPDLIFLDIHMKDLNGFEVLNQIPAQILPTIVFITAFDSYAIQAFDYFAFDYLLKPLREERFNKSIERIIKHFQKSDKPGSEGIQSLLKYIKEGLPESSSQSSSSIALKHAGKICFIEKNEIWYIAAAGYYIEIITPNKKYLIRETLSAILDKLNDPNFIRIHRSTIISTPHLAEIISLGFGDVEVKMKDGKVFRVSKSYKNNLFRKMGL